MKLTIIDLMKKETKYTVGGIKRYTICIQKHYKTITKTIT